MKPNLVKRWADWLGDRLYTWVYSSALDAVYAMLSGNPRGIAGVLGLMTLSAIIVWGLSFILGGLTLPLAEILRALASCLPGSSVTLAVMIFLALIQLATSPMLLSHVRVDRMTGKRELWIEESGNPSGKVMVLRFAFALADAVLLILVVRAMDTAFGETQHRLDLSAFRVLLTILFTLVLIAVQTAAANFGLFALERHLLRRAKRQLGILGPCLSIRESDYEPVELIIALNVLFDGYIYLPALIGLCAVYHESPFRLTIVVCFLAVKLPGTVITHGLSVYLDWRSDRKQP